MIKVKTGKKIKDVVIDADHLLHTIASAPSPTDLEGEQLEQTKIDIRPHKKKFKMAINDYLEVVEVESILYDWVPGTVHLVFSDSQGNFRKKLDPEYKHARKSREPTAEFLKLQAWAREKYIFAEGCEADDVVAYYVRKGAIGITTDKDLYKGVAGIWFDAYYGHREWVYTSKKEARHFTLLQSVAGDPTDNIKGMPRVGLPTAETLLNKYGWDWPGVVMCYESATKTVNKIKVSLGLGKKEAILTRRLIGMDQWKPKRGIKLFKP